MIIYIPPKKLIFGYTNWKGKEYTYKIECESIEYGPYFNSGIARTGEKTWVLNGYLLTRNGDPRDELGPNLGNRRRTFLMHKMDNISEVK